MVAEEGDRAFIHAVETDFPLGGVEVGVLDARVVLQDDGGLGEHRVADGAEVGFVHEVGGGLDVGGATGVDRGEEVARGGVDREAAVSDVGGEVGQGAQRAVVGVGELDLDALAELLFAAVAGCAL